MTHRSAPRPWTRRAWLGAASTAPALLGACARRDEHTLRFWAMGREGEVAAQLVAGFEREHPGVTVQVEQLPWSAAHEKLLTAFAGDATPDLAQMGNTWLPEMAALGAIEPLQDRIAAAPDLPVPDYFPGIWQTNAVDGQRVGLPWYVDTRLLFVRTDLLAQVGFDTVPSTWADWQRCMAALQAGPVKTPLLMPTNEFEPLLALALQQQPQLLTDGGRRGQFNAPGFRAALDFYLQLFERGFAPGVSNNQVANLWQEFGRGSFAFYISGPWNIGEFKRRLPPEQQGNWGTAPLPGPTGPGASIAGGASLVMFKRSRQKPLAWALMRYLSRPQVQLDFYRLTGNLPPRRSPWSLGTPRLLDDPYAQPFAQQLERVLPAPQVPEWERIAQEMQLLAAQAVFHHRSVDQTVRALDEKVDQILAKRRWMQDRAGVGAAR
jgi:multiple sugar transport system substrate-binding protein